MLSMLQQLQGIQPVVTGKRKEMQDEARDRALHVRDALQSIGNGTAARLGMDLPYSQKAIKQYLRALMREGRVVSWRDGNSTLYALARPAPRRR